MQGMRDLLRSGLGRALRACEPLDRLEAAWPVAAGGVLSSHGTLTSIEGGVLTIAVEDSTWLAQMIPLRSRLAEELSRASGVPVREIHFKGTAPARSPRVAPHPTPSRTAHTASAAAATGRPGGRR